MCGQSPGRIDKKIMLGYMKAPHVVQMLEHYFQKRLNLEQIGEIEKIIAGDARENVASLNMTPAQVEQLSAEYDDLDDMIDALKKRGKPASAKSRVGMASVSAISFSV